MGRWVARLVGVLLLTLAAHAAAAADYATPDAAVAALVTALKADSVPALREVFGPGREKLLVSGDPVADSAARRHFLQSLEADHRLDAPAPDRRVLVVGTDNWPFPIPLVESGGRWHFDTVAGAEEIINRRIGQNEIEAIRTMLAIADAQKDYFDRTKVASGTGHYARRFLSSAGKHDGLYWMANDDATPSPLAPLGELAEEEGYSLAGLQAGPSAFQGYRFRMLTAQGPLAPGGAKSYLTGDRLTGGYAVLAWPATFASSGIMSFLLGPDGVVYQTDLGPQTTEAAARITRFDPDVKWTRIDFSD